MVRSSGANASLIWSYSDRKPTFPMPSDDLRLSNDAESDTQPDTTYVVNKFIRMHRNGVFRVKFDLKSGTDTFAAYGKVYINGVATGTERVNSTLNYVTYSQDFDSALLPPWYFQLYIKGFNAALHVITRNFRVYALDEDTWGDS